MSVSREPGLSYLPAGMKSIRSWSTELLAASGGDKVFLWWRAVPMQCSCRAELARAILHRA